MTTKRFICDKCNYETDHKGHYMRHLNNAKHRTLNTDVVIEPEPKTIESVIRETDAIQAEIIRLQTLLSANLLFIKQNYNPPTIAPQITIINNTINNTVVFNMITTLKDLSLIIGDVSSVGTSPLRRIITGDVVPMFKSRTMICALISNIYLTISTSVNYCFYRCNDTDDSIMYYNGKSWVSSKYNVQVYEALRDNTLSVLTSTFSNINISAEEQIVLDKLNVDVKSPEYNTRACDDVYYVAGRRYQSMQHNIEFENINNDINIL